jgi:prephenate dehydrogenase
MFQQLGLIGCGLMGGSFALALKRAGLVKHVVGYSTSPVSTERARQMGVIDVAAATAPQAVSGADIVLLAVPVSATEATFEAIRHLITPDTLIMDVGSTKQDVVDAACRVLRDDVGCFVPAHPITGKELSGVEHADGNLYAGKQVILTPIVPTYAAQLKQATSLWTALGCEVLQMSPQAHDAAYAAVSHLPHLIAYTLMNSISGQDKGANYLSLAGPGFKDFSRIAASDSKMWRDILIANREELLAQSKIFQQTLHSLEKLIAADDGDALERQLEKARQTRTSWHIASQKPHK